MRTVWQFVLSETAVAFLLASRMSDRRRLVKTFDQLANDPFQLGKYQAQDTTGRTIQVKPVGRFLVSYWADHGAKELRVINLERV
jgi:hypothetical protein